MPVSLNFRRAVRSTLTLGLVGILACSDSTAPQIDGDLELSQAAASARRSGRTTSTSGGTTTTTDSPPTTTTASGSWSPPVNAVKFATWTKPSTRDTSFSVVVGTASTHQIMYKGTLLPFLKLEIPATADFYDADGRTLAKGTKVTVTTLVDSVYAAVRFGPHGTQFSRTPARVCLNYYGFQYSSSQSKSMAIWYQPNTATSWAAQPTQIDLDLFWLCAPLSHFSNYAVAY
ncbi:MAG: hypothetical protein ACKVS7_03700 [Gemmatimonadaceae bacterium]